MIIKIHIGLIAFGFISGIKAQTQNSMTEIIPFKTIDWKIIIEGNINGETANFVLDLAGHKALPVAYTHLDVHKRQLKSNDPSYTMPIPDEVLIKNKRLEQNPLAPKREN